jgi:putative acetyltransferase
MATDQWEIRLVRQSDNHVLAQVLREVLIEMDVPKEGTAFADPELDAIYDTYSVGKANYWVVCLGDHIKGGAGIAPLHDGPSGFCELQKMYFLPDARGKGFGNDMIQKCLSKAKSYGFTDCYLETMPNMNDAQKLYKKWGFTYIDHPLGNTGHYSCPIWMVKSLQDDY